METCWDVRTRDAWTRAKTCTNNVRTVFVIVFTHAAEGVQKLFKQCLSIFIDVYTLKYF